MPTADIYALLTDVFRDVFDDDTITATPSLTADAVDGWDSFAHLRLMLAVEQRFGVKFSAAQMSSFANVGDLAATIEAKTGASGR